MSKLLVMVSGTKCRRWGPAWFVIGLWALGTLAFSITRAFTDNSREEGRSTAHVRPQTQEEKALASGQKAAVTPQKKAAQRQNAARPAQKAIEAGGSQAPGTSSGPLKRRNYAAVPKFVVCIDPGHPSEVNDGMAVVNGLREVDVNWEVSLLVREALVKNGVTVVMTKSSKEEMVRNVQRAAIANEAKANLMIRIHADSGGGSGFTIYYPRRQGTAHGRTGPSAAVIQASGEYARRFHAAMSSVLAGKLRDNGIRGDEQSFIGSKQGAFTGSIFSEVPVLLIEMCFLDTKKDADWIRQDANKRLMAHAIASGALSCRNSK